MKNFILAKSEEKEKILDFLYKESPYLNTFLISDIEWFGVSKGNDIITYINDDLDLSHIILYFYSNLVIYFKDDNFNKIQFREILIKHKVKNIVVVGINPEILVKIAKEDNINYEIHLEQFDRLDKQKYKDNIKGVPLKSEKITLNDIPEIIKSRKSIKEFNEIGKQYLNYEYLKNSFKNKTYFGYIIKNKNQILAHAASSSITKEAVMIGGVFSLETNRKKGFATDCTINLCNQIINQGKVPILFWNNPAAGFLYKKLGFKKIGELAVLVKK
ncbi:GNAT family N-acetyltransferase [Mycoplasmopsis cricetuli]|uniref:GNAT family N-acetyltransferase n=1 Tax=Mycoplasmopsis cricetuli TaxID=171283 RepID=UPI0004717248|nr:GNAT family N-acetyltransferase [Mycoplasmopsis cricetuli]